MMFKYAIDQKIVTTNFASLVELPAKEQSEIHKPFTPEELQILWQNADDFTVKIALILCYTGLRPVISELYNPQNEFLITQSGKPIIYQNFLQKYWRKNETLKSLPTKHLPHDGRHTCATLMDDAEVPLKIRQLILGHSSKDITNRVYTHKTIRQLIDAINRI